VVTLELAEARAVLHLVGSLILDRAKAGRPLPYEVRAFHRHLANVVEVSSRRQSKELQQIEFGVSKIGTRQVAALLGWGPRRVQRHVADLGGELVAGRLVFDERTVNDYATALQDREIQE
jgi:hypothetical protein